MGREKEEQREIYIDREKERERGERDLEGVKERWGERKKNRER